MTIVFLVLAAIGAATAVRFLRRWWLALVAVLLSIIALAQQVPIRTPSFSSGLPVPVPLILVGYLGFVAFLARRRWRHRKAEALERERRQNRARGRRRVPVLPSPEDDHDA